MLHRYRVLTTVYTLYNASGPLDISKLPDVKYSRRASVCAFLQVPCRNIKVLVFDSGKVVVQVRNAASFAYTGPRPWPFPYRDFRLFASVIYYGPCDFDTTRVHELVLDCEIRGVGVLRATTLQPNPSKGDNNDRVQRHVLISNVMNELHAQQVITAFLALH